MALLAFEHRIIEPVAQLLYRLSYAGFIQRITNQNYVAGKATESKCVLLCDGIREGRCVSAFLPNGREKRENQDKVG